MKERADTEKAERGKERIFLKSTHKGVWIAKIFGSLVHKVTIW
jgi:hypothetical protein